MRPSKTLQDTCFEACQSQNRACSAKICGTPRGTEVVQQPAPAGEALAAKDEAPAAQNPAAKNPTAKTPTAKTPAAQTSAAKPSADKTGHPAQRNRQ